jgi:hypothetical protein
VALITLQFALMGYLLMIHFRYSNFLNDIAGRAKCIVSYPRAAD